MTAFDASTWANTPVNDGESGQDNPPPEPGLYECVLADARAFTSKAGKDIVKLTYSVASGPLSGYQWDDIYTFEPRRIKATKSTIAHLGVDVATVTSLEQLGDMLSERVGEWFTIRVVQNGEFRSTYVNGPVGASQAPLSDVPAPVLPPVGAGSAAAIKGDDDIPW